MIGHKEERKEVPISRKNQSLYGADNSHREGLVCPSPQIVELQKALDKLIEQKWRASESFRQDLLNFKDLFSVFKVEYDGQLHVPRFSVCMSAEDYDRMVHVPRKQLSDKLDIEQANWGTAKATSDDTKFTEEESKVLEKLGYIGNALAYANGRRRLLKELLEISKETASK